MEEKKPILPIQMPHKLYMQLREAAYKSHRKMAAIAREAIECYLNQVETKPKKDNS